jgi:hypothetical protein
MMDKKLKKLARDRKGKGARISDLDIARLRRSLARSAQKLSGQKPVLKTGTKEKIKGLTQKATMKKLTPKQIQKMKDDMPSTVFKRKPRKGLLLQKRGMKGMRGMMKGAGGAGVMAAAKRAMKKKVKK